MKLHEKIHYYRTIAKLSQEDLAALVGVSRQAVSKWELGEATPEVSKLMALARSFGVTTDELLSETPPVVKPVTVPEEMLCFLQASETVCWKSSVTSIMPIWALV